MIVAVTAAASVATVPGNAAAKGAAEYTSTGSSTHDVPAASSFSAPASAIASAITTSVPSGRCGPCASTAPTGRIATAPARATSRASSQVSSLKRRGISARHPRHDPLGRDRAEALVDPLAEQLHRRLVVLAEARGHPAVPAQPVARGRREGQGQREVSGGRQLHAHAEALAVLAAPEEDEDLCPDLHHGLAPRVVFPRVGKRERMLHERLLGSAD